MNLAVDVLVEVHSIYILMLAAILETMMLLVVTINPFLSMEVSHRSGAMMMRQNLLLGAAAANKFWKDRESQILKGMRVTIDHPICRQRTNQNLRIMVFS